MQSKMILAVCVTLFTMCALWTMAVPKPRPKESAPAAATQPAPAAPTRRTPPSDHVDGVWSPPGFGLRLTAPPDWKATRSRGRAELARDPAAPERGRFELTVRAQLSEEDLALRADVRLGEVAGRSGFELLASEATLIGSRAAWRLEYRVTGADGQPLRTSALLWHSGPQELMLAFSAAEGYWGEVGGFGAAGFASLDLGPESR